MTARPRLRPDQTPPADPTPTAAHGELLAEYRDLLAKVQLCCLSPADAAHAASVAERAARLHRQFTRPAP